ncbi:hypothetical protein QMK33_01455 [Hymenobacter sp. H14-R3]|uniref:hypothetical protein n=1 Tax=Hymenobacter sp. H14-R3 TaxID=3046308 RepID=UPI0024BB1E09|nr:hypothetical protein [Hymenobacter sp. H14-R3]MDJ0363801.1 hypothetical protein [Hymenobacter sp. H14-R3]
MPKLLYRVGYGLALGLASAGYAAAQAPADSSALAAAVAGAGEVYARIVRPESLLFSGPEYADYVQPGAKSHPFFLDAAPQPGTVVYRGAAFGDVPLRYDLALGQVVASYPGQAAAYTLVPGGVSAFTLGGHRFVRLVADSAGQTLPTGYYDLLLSGPVSLLASHTKKIQRTYVQQELRLEYGQTDKLYVRTARTTAEVSSLKNLLALLPAHKDEVQRYAQQHKLSFGAAQQEASALAALRYYYTLLQ